MRWLLAGLLVAFLVLGSFLLAPSPIDSRGWEPPSNPGLRGEMEPNQRLRLADLVARGEVQGPEDVAVNGNGYLFSGQADGQIMRISPQGQIEPWVSTGGRPLGLVFDADENLIVADAGRGLLSINPQGDVRLLTREAAGLPFRLTDGVTVAEDGRIYFTDASSRHRLDDYRLDLFELRPNGRLLRYDPRTGRTEVLLRNLYFASGVTLSPGGDYLLVTETARYRILRYWLKGATQGQAEVFVDNLPGYPSNVKADAMGRYWVALPALRRGLLDQLHRQPWLKDLVAKLPGPLQPEPEPYGLVLALNPEGLVLTSLHDTRGDYLWGITSVTPHDGILYFGSLYSDRIGRLPLSAVPGLGDQDP